MLLGQYDLWRTPAHLPAHTGIKLHMNSETSLPTEAALSAEKDLR